MSIFRFSAEFRFFFYFPLFWKSFSAFFEKSPSPQKYRHTETATIGRVQRAVGKQSMTACCYALLPFPVKVRKRPITTQLSKYDACSNGACGYSAGCPKEEERSYVSLSIAPRQTYADRGCRHFELWRGQQASCSWGGREGRRWLASAEGEG